MPVRPLTKEEMIEKNRLSAICFNVLFDKEKVTRFLEEEENPEKGYWGFFDETNHLQAALAAFEYSVFFQGEIVKMAGIGNVVSLPEARHGGKVRELFSASLQQAYKEDVIFSTLYPFSHSYYEKFGYALALGATKYTISLEAFPTLDQSIWAKQITTRKDLEKAVSIYNQFNFSYNLSANKSLHQWKKALPKDYYSEGKYFYLLGSQDEPNCFIAYHYEKDNNTTTMMVDHFVFSSSIGLFNAFQFFKRFSGQYERFVFTLPNNIPLMYLLSNPYQGAMEVGPQPMVRVINPKAVLSILAKNQPDVSFSIAIHDAFFPKANGFWKIDKGKVHTISTQTTDISLNITTFSQLVCGVLTLDECIYKEEFALNPVLKDDHNIKQFFSVNPFYLTDIF